MGRGIKCVYCVFGLSDALTCQVQVHTICSIYFKTRSLYCNVNQTLAASLSFCNLVILLCSFIKSVLGEFNSTPKCFVFLKDLGYWVMFCLQIDQHWEKLAFICCIGRLITILKRYMNSFAKLCPLSKRCNI